jgi:hypothetical protein
MNTDRLLRDDISDANAAIDVLTEEAKEKNGLLEIDTKAHMLDLGEEKQETKKEPAEQTEQTE